MRVLFEPDVSRRTVLIVLLAAVATAASVGVAVISASASETGAPPGLEKRFATLSSARTNRCNLAAAEVMAMQNTRRLQGSCCFPIDFLTYRLQLRKLSAYTRASEVPRDPYDIPAVLAKRLTVYDSIKLSAREQAVFDSAMRMNNRHGPCCCRCWRWTAFSGQAKFLIARRGYSAQRVAFIWKAEDGCGGKSQQPA